MTLDRRGFLKGAAAGVGLAAVGSRADAFVNITTGRREAPTVDHIVVVMMENRSVDHYFHWVPQIHPSFDAVAARTYLDGHDQPHTTEDWGRHGRNDYAGCGYADPGHGWDSGRVQKQDGDGDGEPDGFLRPGSGNDEFALSRYGPEDLPVYDALVRRFTVFDRYFCSVLASTYPNRYYLHSAQSGGMKNNTFPPQAGKPTGWEWPTIWDAIAEKEGVTGNYYFSNLPVLGLWGMRHVQRGRHISQFFDDCASGKLPNVSFVDPWFVQPEGLANDDHPHADIRLGQEFLSGVVTSFIQSKHWERGALFIVYDEWGGFWDHVMPPELAHEDPRAAEGFGQLGFRTPGLLVSPFGRGVDHRTYDHTSILELISKRFGLRRMPQLDPMARDAKERNIAKAIDPMRYDPEVDLGELRYLAPPEARIPCPARGHTAPPSDLHALAENGWLEAVGWRLDWSFNDVVPW
jgi:phospholipase C